MRFILLHKPTKKKASSLRAGNRSERFQEKIIWIVGALVLLIGISFIYFYHKPDWIEREHQSVIYSFEQQFEKKTTVVLEGEHYRNLFGREVFIGKLKTDEDLEYEIKLTEQGSGFFGILTTLDNYKAIETIGSVMTSGDFDNVWIQLDDINERYGFSEAEGYVAGPADTKEEANEIAKNITKG